jgi:exodeoxyribonuclease-3
VNTTSPVSPPASSPQEPAAPSASPFTVVTWNVNSLRARYDRVLAWLERNRPDVVCLQEIKMQTQEFPLLELQTAGYHAVARGQKTYNGVAILSRLDHGPPTDVRCGMDDGDPDQEARLISAQIPGLGIRVASLYVPNGQTIDADKYAYKLRWLRRFREHLFRNHRPDEPLVLCGDYNIAPGDLDVYDPEGWRDTVICHHDARQALANIVAFGLHDALRHIEPTAKIFSYWDYRQLAFPKNQGLRIDHLFCTAPLIERCVAARVDRDARKGEKPSDHAPVLATFRR